MSGICDWWAVIDELWVNDAAFHKSWFTIHFHSADKINLKYYSTLPTRKHGFVIFEQFILVLCPRGFNVASAALYWEYYVTGFREKWFCCDGYKCASGIWGHKPPNFDFSVFSLCFLPLINDSLISCWDFSSDHSMYHSLLILLG